MSKAKRIVVVDDEFVISWTVGLILTTNGFATYTFTDPKEALRAAVEDWPDLLISDIQMPQMSGIELAIEVCSQCPRCRVLLVSGQAGTEDLMQSARARGYDFPMLKKPVLPEELLAFVSQHLGTSSPTRDQHECGL